VFLLGVDEVEVPEGAFVVYIGTHGDAGAHRANVILPGAAYTEKSGTWVNTEGRVQLGNRAAFPPGDAREDWAILRALSGVVDRKLPFDSLAQLRSALYAACPHMAQIDAIKPAERRDFERLAALGGGLEGPAFRSPVRDFYLTNPIARASAVMAECSSMHLGPTAEAAE
jgi:NADH-quinone oxidoreductase subunit G